VTGLTAGASAGANDVDGGVTSIQSPAINLPSSGTLTLSFAYYLSHLNNSSSADFFRVTIVGSSSTGQVFQELGAATTLAASYKTRSVNISSFAGQQVRILVQAADAATGSLVEASLDNVAITQQP
jgi:aminopeptidase S